MLYMPIILATAQIPKHILSGVMFACVRPTTYRKVIDAVTHNTRSLKYV